MVRYLWERRALKVLSGNSASRIRRSAASSRFPTTYFQRVGLHLKGSRDAIEICTNGCSSQDPANSSRSIWIKMGGQALIGSGKPDEVKQECPHAIPYKSDPDFKLYYKLRESPKGYVPIDASKQETKRAKGSKRNMRDMSAFDNRNW